MARHTPREHAPLPRLATQGNALVLPTGVPVRLLGYVGASAPEATATSSGAPIHNAHPGWLADILPGQRCIAVPLTLARHCSGDALRALDERIRQHARRGSYTLLIVAARLWLGGQHALRLARRYAGRAEVHLALSGRAPLAARVWAAAHALHQAHPELILWLPLECARAAATQPTQPGMGWLWDVAAPQSPHAALHAASRYPVMLYRWQPLAQSATSQNRLMALCRAAGMGWLAQPEAPGATAAPRTSPGKASDLRLRLAVHASHEAAPALPRWAPISASHLSHWESPA